MNILKKKQKKTISQRPLFLGGFILFFLGLLGGVWQYFMGSNYHISDIVSDKAFMYGEIDIQPRNILRLQELGIKINELNFSKMIPLFPSLTTEDLESWIGKKVGFVKIDEENSLIMAQYRNKKNTKIFLQKFLAPEEHFRIKSLEIGELLLPEYSSNVAFMFYKGWVVMGNSEKVLIDFLTSKELLKNNKEYQKVSKDLSEGNFVNLFFNIKYLNTNKSLPIGLKPYKPILLSSKNIFKAGGLTIDLKEDDIKINTKFLVHDDIYKEKLISKPQNQTIPNLAYLLPKDILFFINGNDIYAKYNHTKEFLGSLDPQLKLIFEGVFRAQSKKLFGSNFDLEKDFLYFLRGGYGFVLDFNEGINFAFISELSNTDDITIEELKKSILKAQTQASPVIEEVQISNGKTRKELVIKNINSKKVEEKILQNEVYYKVGASDSFAYSFANPYFIFSTQTSFLEKILKTKQAKTSSLATNNDFRQSILFDFKSSESYGFLNFSKFIQLQNYLDDFSAESSSKISILSDLKPYIRNVIFSRMVYPGEIFMKFIIKQN